MAVAFAAMVAEEVLRCSAIPVVSKRLQGFMSGFADDRDSGPIFITHQGLLLGMAVPMWLAAGISPRIESLKPGTCVSLGGADCMLEGGAGPSSGEGRPGETLARLLVSCAGLICLGLGDTAASVVGVLAGRTRLLAGSRKTWEGMLAGAAAMLLGCFGIWLWSLVASDQDLVRDLDLDLQRHSHQVSWPGVILATFGAAFLEAVTLQMDNLVVPIYYTAHMLLALRINK